MSSCMFCCPQTKKYNLAYMLAIWNIVPYDQTLTPISIHYTVCIWDFIHCFSLPVYLSITGVFVTG
jgi:hypothetical protein